jgi:cyclic pyranopterin phosphate synthase
VRHQRPKGAEMSEQSFSHVDGDGKLLMVDVGHKTPSRRVAEAHCVVVTALDINSLPVSSQGFEPVVAARLAGIHAAKNTSQLIPLCHPLSLQNISVEVLAHSRGAEVRSTVVTVDRTGVEMEALTACSFAALSLLNSLLVLDPRASIEDAEVVSKSGGASGDWVRRGDDY